MKPKKLVLGLIPNNKCNLKCDYCYISQLPEWTKTHYEFLYDIYYIARCLSAKRLGGECLINLTGEGETLLQSNIVQLCKLLLSEGHYIELVTNGTITKVIDEFLELPNEMLERMEFKISFHYKELTRLGLIDQFFNNVQKIRLSPSSFTLELMPNDELVSEIDNIIELCYLKVGAKCQITVGRADYLPSRSIMTQYTKEEYVKIWSKFDSPMFDLKIKLLDVKRREFCYAGDWTLFVNMYTGETSSCYGQPYKQNIFENPNRPIKFIAVGKHCMQPYCINGHAHISMGVIPKLEAPSYMVIRNRKCVDGTDWFSDKGKEFFDAKLTESNCQYGKTKKMLNTFGWYWRSAVAILRQPFKVYRSIKLYINKYIRMIRTKKG